MGKILLYSSLIIPQSTQAVTLKYDQIISLQKSNRKCWYPFAIGKFYYIAHYPPSWIHHWLKKNVKFNPNTDNLRGIYCNIVFYQHHRIFSYIVVFSGDILLWGIRSSTTVLLKWGVQVIYRCTISGFIYEVNSHTRC